MTWSIQSDRTGASLIQRRVLPEDLDSTDSTVSEQLCVARNVCWILELQNKDGFGGTTTSSSSSSTSSFHISYLMGVWGSVELPWSGSSFDSRRNNQKFFFGDCGSGVRSAGTSESDGSTNDGTGRTIDDPFVVAEEEEQQQQQVQNATVGGGN